LLFPQRSDRKGLDVALTKSVMSVSEFESVYRANFDAIWRTLRRMGVPDKDATDAAQEVFLIAYRRLDEFEGRSTMKTWLFGIAFRVASNRRRAGLSQREVLGEHALAAVEPEGNLELELEQRQQLRLLERALSTLPLDQRAVFTMYEMEGLTGHEIASALELPAGTVRSRLRLARAAFTRSVRKLTGDSRPLREALGGGR
jgi:RNA polymerase sigma-70 factor (ECF subfamily)